MGGVMVVILAVALSLWPLPGHEQSAWAVPVVVQDVSTPDPERTVMVYSTSDNSTPDQALTVIWLFSSDAASEES
jgi:hypothetical protein